MNNNGITYEQIKNEVAEARKDVRRLPEFKSEEEELDKELSERLERMEKHPETGVRWRDIRRSGG